MELTWLEVLGLIGVTLVVSTGKIFNGLREYLKDFEHPWNPLRWAGEILSCSMCSGVWIGAGWALIKGGWSWEVLLFAGFISLTSFAANEALGLIGITTLRLSRGMTAPYQHQTRTAVSALAGARARPRVVAPGEDISEEEANALLDEEERRADAAVVPPDEAA
jgi:hypothetical protein